MKGRLGVDMNKRDKEGTLLAGQVTDWVRAWHDSITHTAEDDFRDR